MTEIQVLAQDLLISRTIMLTTILVAITSIVFSSITMAFERSHNVKSLRPFVNLLQVYDQNRVSLSIANAGLGPMLIERITYLSKNDPNPQGKLLTDILPIGFQTAQVFVCNEIYTLAAHDRLTLFEYSGAAALPMLRESLKGLSLCIEYRDVYDHEYKKLSEITL
jgi:hypothetical protein